MIKALVYAGGSAVASDTIWHEVRRLRQSGKPVIVSMGNYAASGGYYISGLPRLAQCLLILPLHPV